MFHIFANGCSFEKMTFERIFGLIKQENAFYNKKCKAISKTNSLESQRQKIATKFFTSQS